MKLKEQADKRLKAKLREIIKKEDILSEVRSWVDFFGEDPQRIPIKRLARFVKAALTRKIIDKSQQARIYALCDEINDLIPISEQYSRKPPATTA